MASDSVDAHLTVTSMGLLGFNTDEYKRDFPGVASELPPMNTSSFEKVNEPLLLSALHFLLTKIDPVEFPHDVEFYWPCLSVQTKKDYKHAVYSALLRLRAAGNVELEQGLPVDFWGSHLIVWGDTAWKLLRILSDACLDAEIERLKPQNARSESRSRTHSSPEVCEGVNPSAPVKRKSIVQQQSEALQSLSRINSFILRTNSATEGDNSIISSRTQLLLYLEELQQKVEEIVTLRIAKQNRIHTYMEELETRLKTARSSIAKSEKQLQSSKEQGGMYALTEAGQRVRATKIERLRTAMELLEDLAQSTILSTAATRLAETKHRRTREDTNGIAEAGSPQRKVGGVSRGTPSGRGNNSDENGDSNGSSNGAGSGGDGHSEPAGKSRKDVPFDRRVEAGKRELLQQANLLYAVDGLATSLQEVIDMCRKI